MFAHKTKHEYESMNMNTTETKNLILNGTTQMGHQIRFNQISKDKFVPTETRTVDIMSKQSQGRMQEKLDKVIRAIHRVLFGKNLDQVIFGSGLGIEMKRI